MEFLEWADFHPLGRLQLDCTVATQVGLSVPGPNFRASYEMMDYEYIRNDLFGGNVLRGRRWAVHSVDIFPSWLLVSCCAFHASEMAIYDPKGEI